MKISDQFLAAMQSDSRETFLLAMGHRLGVAAREIFTGDGSADLQRARACNEMMIAIWSQLWATKDPVGGGYPDTEFLRVLIGKADEGDARSYLRSAIESSLFSIHCRGESSGAAE